MKSLRESILDMPSQTISDLDADLIINNKDVFAGLYALVNKFKSDKKAKQLKVVPKEGSKGLFVEISCQKAPNGNIIKTPHLVLADWQSDNWRENMSLNIKWYGDGSINEAYPVSFSPSEWTDIKYSLSHKINKEEISVAFELPRTKEYLDLFESLIETAMKSGARGCKGLDMYKTIEKYKFPISGIDWDNPNNAGAKKIQDWLESRGLLPHEKISDNVYMKYQIFKVIPTRYGYEFGYDRRIVRPGRKAIEGFASYIHIYEKNCMAAQGSSVLYKNDVGERVWNAITAITDAFGLKYIGDGEFAPR